MTDDRSIERAARSWLEDGPTQAPDHAVESALLQIQAASQERDWHVPWRSRSMSQVTRLLAGAAALAVVLVGGALLLRPAGGTNIGGQPTTSPTINTAANGAVLTAGRWKLPGFVPALTFTVSDPTWTHVFTSKREVLLTAGLPGEGGFAVRNPQNAMQFSSIETIVRQPCTKEPFTAATAEDPWTPPAGTGPEAFVNWLKSSTPLKVGPSSAVSIGGRRGLSVELSAPAGSLADCGGNVKISDSGGFPNGTGFGLAETNARFTVLDVGGKTIVISVEDPRPDGFATLKAAADALLATATFAD